jgi:hypothetical protein
VTDELTLTISSAAIGANEVHAKIYRDTAVGQSYGGSIYLEKVVIEFGVNKWSD